MKVASLWILASSILEFGIDSVDVQAIEGDSVRTDARSPGRHLRKITVNSTAYRCDDPFARSHISGPTCADYTICHGPGDPTCDNLNNSYVICIETPDCAKAVQRSVTSYRCKDPLSKIYLHGTVCADFKTCYGLNDPLCTEEYTTCAEAPGCADGPESPTPSSYRCYDPYSLVTISEATCNDHPVCSGTGDSCTQANFTCNETPECTMRTPMPVPTAKPATAPRKKPKPK